MTGEHAARATLIGNQYVVNIMGQHGKKSLENPLIAFHSNHRLAHNLLDGKI